MSQSRRLRTVGVALSFGLLAASSVRAAGPAYGPEQLVQAGGSALTVGGYSVPSMLDWNNDGLPDLVVGETSGSYGKVRVYLNGGALGNPLFSTYQYVQANGADLSVSAAGCLGAYPRTTYWDSDGRKDLVVGLGDGTVQVFTNTGTDTSPTFDAGTFVQVGQPGSKVNLDVGDRATPNILDWNNDGRKDLVVGGMDGKIHLYMNEGTDTAPDFRVQTVAHYNGADLVVPYARSSPVIFDFNGDGLKDLLAGNTEGQLLYYMNTGTDAAPSFSTYEPATSDGVPINLTSNLRSRPCLYDWNNDGVQDVLVGYGDGKIHLYLGLPEPASLALLAIAAAGGLRRHR